MSNDKDGENVHIRGMDTELKEILDARPGTLAENVNTLLWRGVGGQTQAELERKLEHADRRLSEFDADIRELKEARRDEQDRKEALRSKIEEVDADPTDTDTFEDHYAEWVEKMQWRALHYHDGIGLVGNTASELGIKPDELVRRVMERVVAEDRAIHAKQFYRPGLVTDGDNGMPEGHPNYEIIEAEYAEYREAPRADKLSVDEMGDWEAWSK